MSTDTAQSGLVKHGRTHVQHAREARRSGTRGARALATERERCSRAKGSCNGVEWPVRRGRRPLRLVAASAASRNVLHAASSRDFAPAEGTRLRQAKPTALRGRGRCHVVDSLTCWSARTAAGAAAGSHRRQSCASSHMALREPSCSDWLWQPAAGWMRTAARLAKLSVRKLLPTRGEGHLLACYLRHAGLTCW